MSLPLTKVSPPSEETLARMESSRHLFEELKEVFYSILHENTSHEVGKNNDMNVLLGENFGSHPQIHRFYYDHKDSGVLYVKDAFDGNKHIRKDQAVLLSDGKFTLRDSNRFIDIRSLEHVFDIYRAKHGNVEAVKKFENKYVTLDRGATYFEFDLNEIEIAFRIDEFFHMLGQEFFSYIRNVRPDYNIYNNNFWANTDQVNEVFSHVGNFLSGEALSLDYNIFRAMAPSVIWLGRNKLPRNVKRMPKDSPFGAGVLLSGVNDTTFRKSTEWRNNFTIIFTRDTCVWQDGYIRTNAREMRQYMNIRQLNPEENGYSGRAWLNIVIYDPNPRPITVNERTNNNEGELMNYTADVLEYKVGFKMLEGEKMLMESSGKPPVMLGIEAEYVSRTNRRELISDIANSPFGDHCLMKFDRSIDDGGPAGLEVVTVPASMEYHKKMFSENFFTYNGKDGFEKRLISNARCGIHVHVNKDSFTPLSFGKFISFINSTANRAFIQEMAGRSLDNHYTTPWKLKGVNSKGVDCSVSVATKALRYGKSTKKLVDPVTGATRGLSSTDHWKKRAIGDFVRGAVHIGKAHTIEVRIFKSTTTKTNFLRKIEFIHALVSFCNSEASTQNLTVTDFIKFVLDKTNRKDYPYLLRWMSSKKYIARNSVTNPKTNKKFFRYGELKSLEEKQSVK